MLYFDYSQEDTLCGGDKFLFVLRQCGLDAQFLGSQQHVLPRHGDRLQQRRRLRVQLFILRPSYVPGSRDSAVWHASYMLELKPELNSSYLQATAARFPVALATAWAAPSSWPNCSSPPTLSQSSTKWHKWVAIGATTCSTAAVLIDPGCNREDMLQQSGFCPLRAKQEAPSAESSVGPSSIMHRMLFESWSFILLLPSNHRHTSKPHSRALRAVHCLHELKKKCITSPLWQIQPNLNFSRCSVMHTTHTNEHGWKEQPHTEPPYFTVYQQINIQLEKWIQTPNVQHTIMEMIFSDSSILGTKPPK